LLEQIAQLATIDPLAQLAGLRRRDIVQMLEDEAVLRRQHQHAARSEMDHQLPQERQLVGDVGEDLQRNDHIERSPLEVQFHEVAGDEVDL
jgi:hypothetical protein